MNSLPRAPNAPLFVAVVIVALTAGCDTHRLQDSFADEAARAPEGYTETTVEGEVLVDDPDDWRTSPVYRGRITVDPAFPNPVSTTFLTVSLTVIDFQAITGGGFTLRAYDSSGRNLIALAQPIIISGPGGYAFSFSPGQLQTKGLHRVFIFDLGGEIVSYGDVLVE